MSFIPDKNLFLVTSAIKSLNTKFWSHEQRFQQTVLTVESIRKQVPEAIIVIADASLTPLTEDEHKQLQPYVNVFMDMNQIPEVNRFSSSGHQALAESFLLLNALYALKQQPWIKEVKRIFKISGRSILEPGFNLSEYDDLFGKYVFKKRISTWMSQVTHGATDLLITRMFSLCPSLIDNYMEITQKNLPLFQFMDFEHAHFVNIPKEHLVEFYKIHCSGWLAGNGQVENY